MSIDLWISIVFAIPLSIFANIVTPKLQFWIDSRAELTKKRKLHVLQKRRKLQLLAIKKELDEVIKLHQDKAALIQEHLYSLIKVALYGAIASIYFGMFGILENSWLLHGFITLSYQFISLIVGVLIFNTCIKAMRLHGKVKYYEKYKAESARLISEIENSIVN